MKQVNIITKGLNTWYPIMYSVFTVQRYLQHLIGLDNVWYTTINPLFSLSNWEHFFVEPITLFEVLKEGTVFTSTLHADFGPLTSLLKTSSWGQSLPVSTFDVTCLL
jgi:hypothetical protein